MRQFLSVPLIVVALLAGRAGADPGILTRFEDGILRVALDGSYAGAYYRAYRSDGQTAPFAPLVSQSTLCTGDCFLNDAQVIPGNTYYYRFDLNASNGAFISYGPYAVSVPDTPIATRAWPNPSNGKVRLEFSVPGSSRRDAPLPAEARLLDLQGRTVRHLYSGTLSRGVTSLAWDGRGDENRRLEAGIYFVRMTTPLGVSTTWVIRIR